MVEFVGWLGAILFSLCAAPQVIHVYRTKQTEALSMLFLQMWLWGEIFSLVYVLSNDVLQWPLITNYVFNILLVVYLVYAKIKFKAPIV